MSQYRGRDQSYIVKTFRNDSARYNEHDDRGSVVSREQRYRQGNFKARGRYLRGRGRYQPPSLDDDAEMARRRLPHMQYGDDRRRGMRGRARAPRGAAYRGGRAGYAYNPARKPGQANSALGSWFKITVKNGAQHGRDFIVSSLNENLPEQFAPVGFAKDTNNRDVSFYVENKQMADSLVALDQRIETPNGYKLRIQSRRSEPPVPVLDDAAKTELQLALSSRYTPANRTLNLASFQADTMIRSKGLYMPLWYQRVTSAVADIIVEHIPEVQGINLSRNRVIHLTSFKPLKDACSELKALDLSHNQLNNIGVLDAMSGLPLVELNLDGNKLCDSFNEKSDYISAVRKRFPKVVLLDNVELPPPIEFDVEDDAVAAKKLPESKSSYFCGTQPREVALMFLKQYIEVFDADKRDQLIDAYHEQCRFSLVVCLPSRGTVEKMHNTWMQDSRNLLRVSRERQGSLLRNGKLEVLGALARLPKTQHDTNSFTIDIPVANERLMQITVSGVLREREERHTPVRAFSRVFVIVPHGQGFCIVNEMLVVTPATGDQIKAAFKPAAPTPSPSPVPHVQQVPGVAPAAAAAAAPALTDQLRMRMTQQLSVVTGMNVSWSEKCLQENSFNYDVALQMFNTLKATGKIPPEAFLPA